MPYLTIQLDSMDTYYFARMLRKLAAQPRELKLLTDLVEKDCTRFDDDITKWERDWR